MDRLEYRLHFMVFVLDLMFSLSEKMRVRLQKPTKLKIILG